MDSSIGNLSTVSALQSSQLASIVGDKRKCSNILDDYFQSDYTWFETCHEQYPCCSASLSVRLIDSIVFDCERFIMDINIAEMENVYERARVFFEVGTLRHVINTGPNRVNYLLSMT